MHPAPLLPLRRLARPALLALLAAWLLVTLVAFDQGVLAGLVTSAMSDSGGVLHEFFHDARHLLGVPCH
jgi:Probable cobalt transporter subunit (CbtB)